MPTRRTARTSPSTARSKPRRRKANSPPARTALACSRRSAALRAGSSSAARLLRSACPAPGAAQRKASKAAAAKRERQRRLASLTGPERDALRAKIAADPAAKARLYRSYAAGTLRGALRSAVEKLGPSGLFAFSAR